MMSVYLIITFIIGICIGSLMESSSWRQNAKEPKRLLRGTTFYKVIQLDDEESWKFLKIHKGE